jgi:iron complex transport system permease protein
MGRLGIEIGVEYDQTDRLIIEQVRLPRILTAVLVGMALATAGATMQGLFRNPMADPGIIGVSSGGALAAVLAIVTGLQAVSIFFLPAAAFIGAVGAGFVVYTVASIGGRSDMASLLLTGIAVSAFLGACISLVVLNTRDYDALREILFWLTGGLDARLWVHLKIIVLPVLLGIAAIYGYARSLNIMLSGEESARAMGVSVHRTRQILLVLASLITGVAVSVSGIIGFVGLIVPHAMRLLVGPDHRVLIPLSALGGAIFLIAADTIARLVIQPAELRVGIVTSLVGAPFFLFLLVRNRKAANAL